MICDGELPSNPTQPKSLILLLRQRLPSTPTWRDDRFSVERRACRYTPAGFSTQSIRSTNAPSLRSSAAHPLQLFLFVPRSSPKGPGLSGPELGTRFVRPQSRSHLHRPQIMCLMVLYGTARRKGEAGTARGRLDNNASPATLLQTSTFPPTPQISALLHDEPTKAPGKCHHLHSFSRARRQGSDKAPSAVPLWKHGFPARLSAPQRPVALTLRTCETIGCLPS
jgi:hypothetical protein